MQNEAGWIICILRYRPSIWRYDAEWSGVDYMYIKVPSQHMEVRCRMERSRLY